MMLNSELSSHRVSTATKGFFKSLQFPAKPNYVSNSTKQYRAESSDPQERWSVNCLG